MWILLKDRMFTALKHTFAGIFINVLIYLNVCQTAARGVHQTTASVTAAGESRHKHL